jgi:hypothetical protein
MRGDLWAAVRECVDDDPPLDHPLATGRAPAGKTVTDASARPWAVTLGAASMTSSTPSRPHGRRDGVHGRGSRFDGGPIAGRAR